MDSKPSNQDHEIPEDRKLKSIFMSQGTGNKKMPLRTRTLNSEPRLKLSQLASERMSEDHNLNRKGSLRSQSHTQETTARSMPRMVKVYSSPNLEEQDTVQFDLPEDNNPDLLFQVLTLKALFNASLVSKPIKALEDATRWDHCAGLFMAKGNYEKAAICERHNVKIQLKILGPDHAKTASSIAKFAWCKFAIGDYRAAYKNLARAHRVLMVAAPAEAESLKLGPVAFHSGAYNAALDIFMSKGLEGKMEQALLTNNLGAIYLALNNFPRANNSLSLALELFLKERPNDLELKGVILLNTATLYFHKGQDEEALNLLQGALEAFQKAFGKMHLSVAMCLNNIGAILLKGGKHWDEAEMNLTGAFEIRKKLLNPNHPAIANSYGNLGLLRKNMRDYGGAAEYYRKALSIRKKLLGNSHPDIAVSYNNLAALCSQVGDYDSATKFYLKALEIKKTAFGEEHILLVSTYINLGMLYHKRQRNVNALEQYRIALRLSTAALGTNDAAVAAVKLKIGQVLREEGEFEKAHEMLEKALTILKAIPENSVTQLQTATCLCEIGALLYVERKCAEAAQKFKEAIEIRVKYKAQYSPEVATTYMNMGFAQARGGFYKQACESFENAAQIRSMVLGKDHGATLEAELQAAATRTMLYQPKNTESSEQKVEIDKDTPEIKEN